MRKKYVVLLKLITISWAIIITSCDKQDEPDTPLPLNKETNNDSQVNNNGNIIQYYFRVETSLGNVWPTAGSKIVSLDCNQPWTVSYKGDISGFSYTPSSGEGKGIITISYDEATYNITDSQITWHESGTLTFHIREGNSQNFKNTTYNVPISRYGHKMKV